MSKKSIFLFKMNDTLQLNNINNSINNYLNKYNFHFDTNSNSWINTNNTIDDVKKTGAAIAGGAIGGALKTAGPGIRGFEYYQTQDQVIIKAYLFNLKHTATYHIHSTFNNSRAGALYLSSLKKELFNDLLNYGVSLYKTETENINDKSSLKTMLTIFGIFGLIILIIVIFFLVMVK